MSTVAFYGNPYAGHTVPTIPVAAELVRRGERVVYYSLPDFAPAIEAAGAEFRCYPELPERLPLSPITDLSLWVLEAARRIMASDIANANDPRPDYILHDVAAVWGACIGDIHGIPTIQSSPLFPMNWKVMEGVFARMPRKKFRSKSYGGLVRNGLEIMLRGFKLQRALGLSSQKVLFGKADQHLVYTARSLQPRAEDFQGGYWFVGAPGVERSETAPMPEEVSDSKPIVLFSMGTFCRASKQLVRTCIEALAPLDVQVVMVLDPNGYREELAGLPDNFVVKRFVPQLALLRRSAAFINHGGVGSASEALYFGVPMVLVPQAFDHFLMAERCEIEGAGLMFADEPTAAELRDAVRRATAEESFRENAERLGRDLSEAGGAKQAASLILDWAAARSNGNGLNGR